MQPDLIWHLWKLCDLHQNKRLCVWTGRRARVCKVCKVCKDDTICVCSSAGCAATKSLQKIHLKMNMMMFLLLQGHRSTLNPLQITSGCNLAPVPLLPLSPSSIVKDPLMWDYIMSRDSFSQHLASCVYRPSALLRSHKPADPSPLFLLPQFKFSPSFHPSHPSLFFSFERTTQASCGMREGGQRRRRSFEAFGSPE